VRPGDSIVISRDEAELLESDAFAQTLPREVVEKMTVAPAPPDGYRVELPNVGRPVIDALQKFAQARGREAIAAEQLATAIEKDLAAE
jgi:hypothetical protein